MGRGAKDVQAFSVLLGTVACGLACLSALACGGLADDRRSAPVGMFGASGGPSQPRPAQRPDDGCNPLIDGDCGPAPVGSTGERPVELCSDNPLLVDCVGPRPAQPDPELPPESIVEGPYGDAENVLDVWCGACHGSSVFQGTAIGGLADVQDLSKLRQGGFITDCSADNSRIIQVMRSGSMPPLNSGLPSVPSVEIDVVARAIEFGCTDTERSCAGDPARPGCGVVLAERALERSCGVCHGQRARDTSQGILEGLSYIDDMVELIATSKVVPCQPDMSPVLVRVRNGSMPPRATRQGPNGSPFTSFDDTTVASFIEGLCPGPASPEDTDQLRAEGLLGRYCGECHGQRAVELGQVQGSFEGVESVDVLVRTGRLLPCLSEASPIVMRLLDGSMPPPASTGPRPSASDIQVIADFVDRPCVGP